MKKMNEMLKRKQLEFDTYADESLVGGKKASKPNPRMLGRKDLSRKKDSAS